MVVLQRHDISRNRIVYLLTVTLSAVVLGGVVTNFSGASELMRLLLVILGGIAGAALVLSLLQLYALPGRAQVLLFQNDEEVVIATNAIHEGFKLRFLRDILGENVTAFNDEDRARWKPLESDGYYAALHVRNVRKLILLRLCTMIFDDVFFADPGNRWEHHECSSTAEPTFPRREMPRLNSWKSST
jgi:hypothetical protein